MEKEKCRKKIISTGNIRKYHKISRIWDFAYFQQVLHWTPQNSTVPVPKWNILIHEYKFWNKLYILTLLSNNLIFKMVEIEKMHFLKIFPTDFFRFFTKLLCVGLANIIRSYFPWRIFSTFFKVKAQCVCGSSIKFK